MNLLRHIASLLLAACLATPALSDPALWKVSDADSSIYLFGSVHVFPRQMDWRTPQFDQLLGSADHVYFEVVMDVDAYSTIMQVTLQKGMFRDGRKLADVLDPSDYARLQAVAGTAGADMATLDAMMPWLAAMTLATGAYPQTSAGVETLLDPEVPADRKRGLETAEEQMNFLADLPLADQIDSLLSTIEGLETGAISDIDPMLTAWESGDTAALASAIGGMVTEKDRVMYDRLLTERNQRWIASFEDLLATNDESLVIVGAAHLVGPDGVPTLLRDKGYRVERIDGTRTGPPPETGPRRLRNR